MPISFGIRLNGVLVRERLREDIARMRHYGSTGLQVELMVENDPETGMPLISPASLQEWRKIKPILKAEQLQLTLSFTSSPYGKQSITYLWHHSRRKQWFDAYHDSLVDFLQANKDLPLHRLVVGNHYSHIANYNYTPEWQRLLQRLRRATKARLAYAAPSRYAAQFPAWQYCDEIGVNYVNTETSKENAANDQKRRAQMDNADLRKLAEKYGKPVYLSHANLIGHSKLVKLKNRLRFYGEVPLAGICLNSIGPETVLTASDPLWLLDEETLTYLRGYTE